MQGVALDLRTASGRSTYLGKPRNKTCKPPRSGPWSRVQLHVDDGFMYVSFDEVPLLTKIPRLK